MKMKKLNILGRVAFFALTLFFILSAFPISASAAANADERWSNGWYVSSFGDMAARRLYVYGLIDSESEATAKSTDKDLSFSAEKQAGRLDAAKLLFIIAGEETETKSPFSDVPEAYTEAVDWLYSIGVTKGIDAEHFGTGDMTEYHFLVMLSRLLDWHTEELNELRRQAGDVGLLPYYHGGGCFSLGDMYQIACALLDMSYPAKRQAVHPCMSTPTVFQIFPKTFQEAENQIKAAVEFLPSRIEVFFREDCSREEIKAFTSYYDRQNANNTAPLTGITNGMLYLPWSLEKSSESSFRLYVYSYSQGYIAYVSDSDWLRVYSDEDYCESLRSFRREYLTPLDGKPEYEKAKVAHDLICRLASYDYATANYRAGSGEPFHGEAHDITGFIQDRSIVCDGYANTYQWMLNCLGMESYMVIGRGDGALHAWNKVKIGGRWYNADVCWDDTCGNRSKYFLKSDRWFEANGHSFTDSFSTTAFPSPANYG